MTSTGFPAGFRLERIAKAHPRSAFRSGEESVDAWLATQALQHFEKRLSSTSVLLDPDGAIAGYYTIAAGQVDFGDLPSEIAKRLPRRSLPVAILAWLGVDRSRQGSGLGKRLLARALHDCHTGGKALPFIAVILDCLGDAAKVFYSKFGFQEMPGRPYRLFLSAARLEAMQSGQVQTGPG